MLEFVNKFLETSNYNVVHEEQARNSGNEIENAKNSTF